MLSLPRLVRSLFFWSVVCIFFITAASVLFHTFGYRFSLERGIFIYTGSITIEANPADVEVTINGEKVSEKGFGVLNNSIHIGGLAPGEYFVEVSAPGYQSWTKKVVVESGRSTEFWNVQLTRGEPAWEDMLGTENAFRIIASPQKNIFAVVKKTDETYTIDLLNTDTGKSEEIFSTLETLPADEKLFLWSPSGRYLLVPLARADPAYYRVDVQTKDASFLQPAFPHGAATKHLRFDPTTENLLLVQYGPDLYRLDTGTPDSAPVLLAENIAAFDTSGRSLYYLSRGNGIVYSAPLDRNTLNPVQITRKPISVGEASDYQLSVYDEQRFSLLEKPSGRFFAYNTESKEEMRELAGSGIRGMQFSDDGKKLLFFTQNEISVYFTRVWEVQPGRAADSVIQMGRFSEEVGHVQWTKDYEHVLFTLGTSLKVLELDHRDRRNILDVARLPAPPLQVHSDFADNRLFLVVPKEAGAPVSVRSLVFPEPTGFFGFR